MTPTTGTLESPPSTEVKPFRPDCPECPERPHLRVFKSTVYVSDHDRSLDFYVNQLGFSVLADVDAHLRRSLGRHRASRRSGHPRTRRTQTRHRQTPPHRPRHPDRLHLRRHQRHLRALAATGRALPPAASADHLRHHLRPLPGHRRQQLRTHRHRPVHPRDRAGAPASAPQKIESDRRTAQELEIAKQVQARLFPQTLPHTQNPRLRRHLHPGPPRRRRLLRLPRSRQPAPRPRHR